MESAHIILVVDGNADDLILLRYAFAAVGIHNPWRVADTLAMCRRYLNGTGEFADRNTHPLPKIIILDLTSPVGCPFELLREIRAQDALKNTPIIALGMSDGGRSAQRAFDAGANAFFDKGVDLFALARALNELEFLEDIRSRKTEDKQRDCAA